jgi:hypothetical protein
MHGDIPELLDEPSELLQPSSVLLQQLLDACHENNQGALQLAQLTEIEALRHFLQESARQYRRAAHDIRTVCQIDATRIAPGQRVPRFSTPDEGGADVAANWERAECEALTYFRDAYDGPLTDRVAETVKRHFEVGVARLERLRKLQAQLA